MADVVLGVGTGVFIITLIWILTLALTIILSRATGPTKLGIIPVVLLALIITLVLVFFPRAAEVPAPQRAAQRKLDPFVRTIHLPHPFKSDINKVVVFTEKPDQARIALENGAAVAGGVELFEKILADEITADFYLAEPDILPKLVPLKNKLRKKFPKSKRGTVGINIPRMLELFKTGHEYIVEDIYVNTEVATLDMPKEHILENIHTILKDVASHKPAEFGPIIDRAIVCSRSSEGLHLKLEELLPQEEKMA